MRERHLVTSIIHLQFYKALRVQSTEMDALSVLTETLSTLASQQCMARASPPHLEQEGKLKSTIATYTILTLRANAIQQETEIQHLVTEKEETTTIITFLPVLLSNMFLNLL